MGFAPHDLDMVVAVDESTTARAALRWAVDEAARTGRGLHAIHVIPPPFGIGLWGSRDDAGGPSTAEAVHLSMAKRRLGALVGSWIGDRDVLVVDPDEPEVSAGPVLVENDLAELAVTLEVREGSPIRELTTISRRARVLVMGTPRRTWRPWHRSVSRELTGRVACPLMLVPTPGEDSAEG